MLNVPDVGEVVMLGRAINAVASENLILKLFIANVATAESNVASSFTEMVAAGYASKTLTAGSWTISTVGGVTTATYAQQVISPTAATSCWGYYIVGATSGTLYWAENFGADYPVGSGGGDYKITPKITLE